MKLCRARYQIFDFRLHTCTICRRRGIRGLLAEISVDILSKKLETAKMMVPCFLYFIQNNLLLVAVANLEPPVYYVVSQVTDDYMMTYFQ